MESGKDAFSALEEPCEFASSSSATSIGGARVVVDVFVFGELRRRPADRIFSIAALAALRVDVRCDILRLCRSGRSRN